MSEHQGSSQPFTNVLTPRQQLLIKKELDDVALRTIHEISTAKTQRFEAPLTDSDRLKWTLEPNFYPEKHIEPRKSHPVYHDRSTIKPAHPKPTNTANIPNYNALDKKMAIALSEKTTKYPYNKPEKTTPTEMKKTKKSTVGVLPNSRDTTELGELNLIMEGGKPDELKKARNTIDQMERSKSGVESNNREPSINEGQFFHATSPPLDPKPKMPAILSHTGTLGGITMSQRPQVIPKNPSVNLEKIKARELAKAKKAQAAKLAKERALLEIRDMEDDERTESEASTTSLRSAKDLLEEAQSIAAGVHTEKRRRKDKRKSMPQMKEPEKNVRTVDEIIASLKTQNADGETQETEADRQIREIMGRVMKHANAVLGNIEDPSPTDTEPEPQVQLEVEEPEDKPAPSIDQSAENLKSDMESSIEAPNESELDTEPGTDEATRSSALSRGEALVKDILSRTASEAPSVVEESGMTPEKMRVITPDMLDLRQAYRDMILAPQVKYEDIVSVHGQVKTLVSKLLDDGKTKEQVSLHLADIQEKTRSYIKRIEGPKEKVYRQPNYERNVHLFCTAKHGVQMPSDLARATRAYHSPDQIRSALKKSWVPWGKEMEYHPETFEIMQEAEVISDSALARKRSVAARTILDDAKKLGGMPIQAWKEKADEVFSSENMQPTVNKAPLLSDETRTFFSCAPPKMAMMSSQIREHLFPRYYGAAIEDPAAQGGTATAPLGDFEDEEDFDADDEPAMNPEKTIILNRLLERKYHSCQDLTHLLKSQMQQEADEDDKFRSKDAPGEDSLEVGSKGASPLESGRLGSKQRIQETPVSVSPLESPVRSIVTPYDSSPEPMYQFAKKIKLPLSDDEIFPAVVLKRSDSAPALIELRDDFLAIPEDFTTAMSEIERQRKQITLFRDRRDNQQTLSVLDQIEDEERFWMSTEEFAEKRHAIAIEPRRNSKEVEAKPTLAEEAIAAGRKYVVYKKKLPKKKQVDMSRITEIEKFLYTEPRKLERTESIRDLKKVLPERSMRVPSHVRERRRGSVPDLLEWQRFQRNNSYQSSPAENEREWVRSIWNGWFDEVFPLPKEDEEQSEVRHATDEESELSDGEENEDGETHLAKEKRVRPKSEGRLLISDEEFMKIEMLDPLPEESEEEMMMREALEEEIEKVQNRINSLQRPLPFDFCRLGAIQRKLGQLRDARLNLCKAIEMEPSLLHAYWQRHLLYLLQGKKTEALEDLNHILKLNRMHAGAYISRAGLVSKDDTTMAVTNLTQAIKIQPTNADIFMKRAAIYEARGQQQGDTAGILLAMEDYAKAYKLNPKLTQAIFNRAKYYFKQKNWTAAINDFTEFLKKSPYDATARLLRGRAYTNLAQNQKAVQDLGAAVHMDPNNWEAFYYRACIFRKAHPQQALLDYSMSILINDTEDNINSLLHRGVLYDSLGQPDDAIADFEAILKLRKDVAVAHLNLGLIYLTKMEAYQSNILPVEMVLKAIRKFTSAIKCDPTFVRAYICRAEAYKKIHDHKNASLDYTRAIHLRPEVPDFYMQRGMTLLKLGNTDLASFCVRHVSELFADSDLGQSATQQAVVHSFLKNYPKAIMALDNALRSSPNPPLFILLGKTQMKAKLWQEAIDSFSKALEQLKPWKPKERWPKEAAEVNYLMGLCCLELRNYLQAHDCFNNAIEIDKKYAEAMYQRGVAKLRLKQNKGLQDINKALALDRTLFQAYLTRAAYYGMRGQISKAIMNCNEAIKLKPRSVRGYLYRGALKYHGKAYELAIKDLTQATRIDNTCSLAYFNRAVCYHGSGHYHKALTDYGIVLLLGDQLMLKVLINRGLLYLSRRDYKNALHDFLLAAKVHESDPKIRHTLGLCMHKLRRLKEAVAIFSEALEMSPFFLEAFISRGNAFLDYGNDAGIKAAQCDYQRALSLNPVYMPARVNLAYSLQMSGKLQQAWNQFTTAIEQDSRCQAAYEGRAIVNLQMSNLFGALQDINASINIKQSAELHTNRGVINLFMKDAMGAMHDFQAAIKNDPCYSLAYFNAANIYFKNRQFRQALAYYDQSIQFRENDESAFVNRAITRATIKDYDGAMKDFSRAIEISPKSAHIYFNRGCLHAAQEHWQKAEDDYSIALKLQPDDPLALKRRADARGKLGMKDQAIEDYQYAIQLQARIKYLKTINTK